MQLKKDIEKLERYVIAAIESDFPMLKVESVEDVQMEGKDMQGVVTIKGVAYFFLIERSSLEKAKVPHPTLQRLG